MRKKLLRSRSGFEKPESREEAIMQNILGASNVLEPSESNIEEILKSILYNTPYTEEAEFEIEKILLAIKNNGTYDGEGESRDTKILIAILNDLDYTEEAESRIEELFVEWLHQRSNVNVLEGVPPLTFVAKGNPLINYEISGNTVQSTTPTPDNPIMPQGTGERTGNLFDEVYSPISGTIRYRPIFVGDGTFTLSTTTPYDSSVANVFLLSGNVSSGVSTPVNGAWKNHNVTAQSVDGYVTIAYRHYSGTTSPVDCQTMLNSGSAPLPYEIFGYKIPITCGGVTTDIYIGDSPLYDGDTISMTDTGIEIPTVYGNNVLTVDTTVQPSNIYIEYK